MRAGNTGTCFLHGLGDEVLFMGLRVMKWVLEDGWVGGWLVGWID